MNRFFRAVSTWWNTPVRIVPRAVVGSIAFALWSYLGAQRWSEDRGHVPGYVQDARFDADASTRYELVRKARFFEKNNAIVNRWADLFEQFTVGAGLPIFPDSTDDDWNEAAREWWQEWQLVCDQSSLQSFGTIQSLIARSWFIDGEIFILKTRGDTAPYRPRIQLIEAHRVETPPSMVQLEGKTIIDGIEIDEKCRPTAYWVRDGLDTTTYRRFPAESIIHVFEPSRPGQMRGLPFTYPVINDLVDLDDLQVLEMRAAKDAAEKSTFLLTKSSELNADESRRNRWDETRQQDSKGNQVIEKRLRVIQDRIGGKTAALATGEDVKQFVPQRPSAATREYWDYLTARGCIGVGMPKLLVFPNSIQGTVARADLDIAAGWFRIRSAVLQDAFRRIYVWVMSWAVVYDGRLDGAPKDGSWKRCRMRAPRGPNVDVGRNSAAMLAELEGGARTYESVYGDLGEDWMPQIEQRAKEEAFIDKMAAKYKVAPDRIRKAISESLKTEMALEGQKQQEREQQEDEELLRQQAAANHQQTLTA